MNLQTLLAITTLAASGTALAQKCTYNGYENCEWYGTAPFCGSTDYSVGDAVNGRKLVASTEKQSQEALCYFADDSPDNCCRSYGAGCWSGYKQLWCDRKMGMF
ncbi:hypothetical protein BDV25DRAFT_138264 [Aspergillus avenaceus]|uniref:Uncharacterized protein n=1 Tax=Aspergillus avenaceus TaxID=36643 RepID=A0A5N6U0H4_ASPAV|nr:hypothetical protein BDV25DRAFT_138264 [Aspergillus avenaceus]